MELRQYQKDAVNNAVRDYRDGHKSCGIILPTGGGKTQIFTELIKRHLDKRSDGLALVLSHLSILTTQSQDRMNSMYPDVVTGTLQAKITPPNDARAVFSTMHSAREATKISKWLNGGYGLEKKVTFIVIDEAHHTQTESYDKILKFFPDVPVLYVTATPYKEAQVLLPYFGKISYSISTQELIDQGYLVPPKLIQVLLKGHHLDDRIAQVVETYQREEMGKQAIVFLKEIQDCKLCRNAFERIGVKCEAVNSDVTGTHRDNILDSFRARDIQVLTTCSVLSEGFDAPCVEVCFLPYRTGSPTLYLQRIGRLLRTYPDKKDARIYAFGDAPSIKKGIYKRIHSMAMDKGGSHEPDIFDDLEYLDLIEEPKNSPAYSWTQEICKVATKMEKLGCYHLYDLIRYKNFPNKFLKNLGLLGIGLDINYKPDEDGITSRQYNTLRKFGFTDMQINYLDKGNASAIIAMVSRARERSVEDNMWVLTDGKYFGYHIKEIPGHYRKLAFMNGANGYQYKGYAMDMIRSYYRLKRQGKL